jgi:CHAT domain-containing protein/tetratricopeptide (TPR) repeat protein
VRAPKSGFLNLLPLLAALVFLPSCASLASGSAGVVVETVFPQAPGALAGLRPGDVLLFWSSGEESGPIDSPYDLVPLDVEVSPRRPVTLQGRRGRKAQTWTVREGDWGIRTRPVRSAAGDRRFAAWFLQRHAQVLSDAGQWSEADAAWQKAIDALEADPGAAAFVLGAWGETFHARGAWDASIERHRRALALQQGIAPKSLAAANTLTRLGYVTYSRGDREAGEELLRQGFAMQEELAPGTLLVAAGLGRMGVLANWRGDLAAAEELFTRAEELQRRLAPRTWEHGRIFLRLGNVAAQRSDLEAAETWLRRAIAVFERTDPEGDMVADGLLSLASVAIARGDLASADDLLRRTLDLQERGGAGPRQTWLTLKHLGTIALQRGDLEAAETYYRRALALAEGQSSLDEQRLALSLGLLGELALLQRDLGAAREYMRRAQAIDERLDPASLAAASGLDSYARIELESGGDPGVAEDLQRRALAAFETRGPESLGTAVLLRSLGETAERRGRREEALAFYRRALGILSRIVPGSTEEARTLHLLGLVERRAGAVEEGGRDLCRAIDVLDRQRARLGGTPEARTAFEATLGGYYHACLEARVEDGHGAEAFHVLERGRARAFLDLLAERDVRPPDLPPELAAERRRINAEYDRVQAQLAVLSAGRDDAEIERLRGELRDLRSRQEEIAGRIRRESPRSAALQDPQPLDLDGARAALDPGTVLLEYAVGEERSWLFAVDDTGFEVFPIALGAEGLRNEVESFRLLLKDSGSALPELQAQARRLYGLLVGPAEARIAGAQRILVSPDGPLHTLAFAALWRGDQYLVEWKPIHSVLSVTVYAELARSRRPAGDAGEPRLAAFGNPVYPPLPAKASAGPEVREAVLRGLALVPLPSSGREVEAIAGLYPRAEVYLGSEATEERAKALGPEARLIHFACHGLLDERFPLNSALALSVPEPGAEGRDNGLLQAWEIFESVRLDADLVTLSACDTALGREMGGEGLVGLTRAFQYAGARSVLASLWSVADLSTARFMQSFYGHLRAGMTKDEALRAAQLEQVRDSHPFHWAAFQLTGDWK